MTNELSELFVNVQHGDLQRLAALLKSHPELLNAIDPENGETVLHWAARHGSMKVMALFLRKRADVNIRSFNESTPLSIAIEKSNVEAVRHLIAAGANPGLRVQGHTLLDLATWYGPLAVVNLLLKSGCDVNAVHDNGIVMPLYHAVWHGDREMTKALILAGADVNLRNDAGSASLHTAIERNHPDMVRLLLEHGARANETDGDGQPPLLRAILWGQVEIASILIAHGADVNAANDEGQSPLIEAARHGQKDVVGKLLERGADVKRADNDGATALHYAAEMGWSEITAMLFAGGAQTNALNARDKTPLTLAEEGRHHDVVSLLGGSRTHESGTEADHGGSDKPVVTWFSDPARPDETVMLFGYGFGSDTAVEIARLGDGEKKELDIHCAGRFAWRKLKPLTADESSLMFVLPKKQPVGVWACRTRSSNGISDPVLLNAPDPWWMQGDQGLMVSSGGWLRVFGKCLNFGGKSRARLEPLQGGKSILLTARNADCYALRFDLPAGMRTGKYNVKVHNGYGGAAAWKTVGALQVSSPVKPPRKVFNVADFGADPYDEVDVTGAVRKAISAASAAGSGIVWFPRGRYLIAQTLRLPPGVILKGEGMDVVSLFWPDSPTKRMSLISGGKSFGVEDLSLYTQGEHHDIIRGYDNVKIRRVRIRADWLYCLGAKGERRYNRRVDQDRSGVGISLNGRNIEITDCDLFHSIQNLALYNAQGGLVARNKLHHGHSFLIACARGLIFEDNEGVCDEGGGNGLSLYCGNNQCRHVYFARNTIQHVYRYDREGMTLDGHGTAYLGKIESANGRVTRLAGDHFFGDRNKDMMPHWQHGILGILTGKGAGQYRNILYCDGRRVEVDRPWLVPPDKNSVAFIGRFNGRHLFVENKFLDTGTVIQLYPPNYECVVAGNTACRAYHFNSGSVLTPNVPGGEFGIRVEPSWFNQFLDNKVIEGNGWGVRNIYTGKGSTTGTDQWIGGGALLNIYGRGADIGWPISRGQIVRRHKCANNSSIRVVGAVAGALIENCEIRNNRFGIEVGTLACTGVPSKKGRHKSVPANVVLRGNRFVVVEKPFCGNAIAKAMIVPVKKPLS